MKIRDLDNDGIQGEEPASPTSWTEAEWNARALRAEYTPAPTFGTEAHQAIEAFNEARRVDQQPRSTTLNPYYIPGAPLVAQSSIYAPQPAAPAPTLSHRPPVRYVQHRPTHPVAVVKAVAIIFAVIFLVGYLLEWIA